MVRLGTINSVVLVLTALIDQLSKSFVFGKGVLFLKESEWCSFAINASINPNYTFSIPAPYWLILSSILIVLSVVVYYWMTEIKNNRSTSIWIALILGGAVGNLADRLFNGGVIDFIELGLFSWSWSSFNFADIFIIIGIIGWFIHSNPSTKTSA